MGFYRGQIPETFCRGRPQKRPSIPCSCSKTHAAAGGAKLGKLHGQARPSAQATTSCPVILCWLDRPKALHQDWSLCRRRSKIGQVQKGKKKIKTTARRLQKSYYYRSATPQQREFHLQTFTCLPVWPKMETKAKSSLFSHRARSVKQLRKAR